MPVDEHYPHRSLPAYGLRSPERLIIVTPYPRFLFRDTLSNTPPSVFPFYEVYISVAGACLPTTSVPTHTPTRTMPSTFCTISIPPLLRRRGCVPVLLVGPVLLSISLQTLFVSKVASRLVPLHDVLDT